MCVCVYVLIILQSEKLYDAARGGNLPEALAALESGADVNWLNKHSSVNNYILRAVATTSP